MRYIELECHRDIRWIYQCYILLNEFPDLIESKIYLIFQNELRFYQLSVNLNKFIFQNIWLYANTCFYVLFLWFFLEFLPDVIIFLPKADVLLSEAINMARISFSVIQISLNLRRIENYDKNIRIFQGLQYIFE